MGENINGTNQRDLQLTNKPWIVPWGTERMAQRIQKQNRVTLHISAHLKRGEDQTEKSSYSEYWLQKVIWYGSTKLENKLPEIVQNIRLNNKLYQENNENLMSGIDSRRKELSWSKDP